VLGYPNGRRMFYSALRQLLVTALATAVTFFVGRLFGAPVS
jgi:VIT1/CCC1 family predicted Fe2+/Mn2+ transporter